MARLDQRVYRLVDVADEDHRRIGVHLVATPGERSGRHIVLHDLDASIVLEADSGDLIEGHYIPEPNQSNSSAGQVVKQVCNGGLPP